MGCNCGYSIGHPLVPVCTCKKKKKREWVNLTLAEREELRDSYQDSSSGLISAVQMLLKEKNEV